MFGLQIFQVTDSIWCLRRPSYLTCSYVVMTRLGPVLIDAGMDSTGQDILAALSVLKQPASTVRAILLTHWHNDHAAGARALQQASSCPVYYHEHETPFLTRTTAHGGLRGWLASRIPEWGIFVLLIGLLGEAIPERIDATSNAKDGDLLADDFEVIETPGHTPGHISFYYRPEKALFAGDALAVINGAVRFMARPVTPNKEQARESMRRCLDREIQVLCPGHRGPLTQDVAGKCDVMRRYLAAKGSWPLFG